MQYHQERKLRLHTNSEYSSLYTWAIIEVDDRDRQVGSDQIPWEWSLHFEATTCLLSDSLEIGRDTLEPSDPPQKPKATHRRAIRMPLRPWFSPSETYPGEPALEMFGTGRTIQKISLEIHPTSDPNRQQTAGAWGCLSYTSEDDFHDVTTDDCLEFYLSLSHEEFDRYASMIAQGHVSSARVSVGSVAGFYSEWSPSITAQTIKVLTQGSEQHVELPSGLEFEPPRLGLVGRISVTFTRFLNFE